MTFELPLTVLSKSNHLTGQCGQAWAVVSSGILARTMLQLHNQTQQLGNHASTALLSLTCSCTRGLNKTMAQPEAAAQSSEATAFLTYMHVLLLSFGS